MQNTKQNYVSNGEYPKYMEFKYPLDNFQLHGCSAIDNNENVLATAHTGSGKTTLALYAIAKCFALGQKVIYTSPIKTLSNQKFKEFTDLFPSVGIITGDVKINPTAQCLIMTAEILKNSLLRQYNDTVYDWNFNPNEVAYIILDEVHFINNPERGKVWEEILINLPSKIRLVMLSATISGANEMVEWLGNLKKVKCHLVSTVKRPVPLKHAIYWDDKLHTFLENDTQWNLHVWANTKKEMDKYFLKNKFSIVIFHKCLEYLRNNNLTPCTVFLLNREMVEKQAKTLPNFVSDHLESAKINKIWGSYLRKYKDIYEHTEQWNMVFDLVNKGIGVHHSGMIPILKEIVEILYSEGLIKVLLATETFAMGVNMPTKSVIFTNLTKFDGNEKRLFRPEEYGQMAGRAGRRGLDVQGTVIILPFLDFITEQEAKTIILAPPQKIKSKLSIDYSLIIKILNHKIDSNNEENTIDYLVNILSATLFNDQDSKNGSHLINKRKELESKLDNLVKLLDKKDIEKRQIYERIKEIDNKLNPKDYIRLDKKQEKLAIKEKKDLEEQISPSTYKSIDSWITLENQVIEIRNEIEFNETKLRIHIQKILNFLEVKEMVTLMNSNYTLSKKGRIMAEINECNSLVMTKIIEASLFDELDFDEIMGILSLFIADKDKEDIYLDELDISNKEKNIIKKIIKFSEDSYDDEIKLVQGTPFHFRSEWNLSYNMYNNIKEWAKGKNWLEMSEKTFEGNFIKNVLRLCNLTRNIEMIAKLLNNMKLLDKLNGYQEKLIRGIVITDSLYL